MNAAKRPLIVITCSSLAAPAAPTTAPTPDRTAALTPAGRESVPVDYIRCVVSAGGAPIVLPNTGDAESVAAAMSAAGGLILSGGGDVAADFYGRPAHPATANVDRLRDATEKAAVAAALREGLPILAICRGIQMLNVAMGGTLLQDIPTWRPDPASGPSEDAPAQPIPHQGADHDVRVDRGSLLHRLWGRQAQRVNSTHHQAVERVAAGLRVIARSSDGIIEAVESDDSKDILGVQFHPERLAHADPHFLAPFQWLVDRAVGRRQPGSLK